MDITLAQIAEWLIKNGGAWGMMLLILWTGYKRVWVWGHQYREMVKDRDEWKDRAQQGVGMVGRAISVAASQQPPVSRHRHE